MEHKSFNALSDYQRAVLTEMGVVYWQLSESADPQDNQDDSLPSTMVESTKVESTRDVSEASQSEPIPQEQALAKLKALKESNETASTESTNAVLLTWQEAPNSRQIVNDVLTALGLDTHTPKYISDTQLGHFCDYPLVWKIGDELTLEDKALTTPPIDQLGAAHTKKQLWRHIQRAVDQVESK